jgi:hypothetical protein
MNTDQLNICRLASARQDHKRETVMIKDAQGRKWAMRFKQYSDGWQWNARWKNLGQSSDALFPTKVLAEDNARRFIQGHNAVAHAAEFWSRVAKRGSECRLTPEDIKAIQQAGEEQS